MGLGATYLFKLTFLTIGKHSYIKIKKFSLKAKHKKIDISDYWETCPIKIAWKWCLATFRWKG